MCLFLICEKKKLFSMGLVLLYSTLVSERRSVKGSVALEEQESRASAENGKGDIEKRVGFRALWDQQWKMNSTVVLLPQLTSFEGSRHH